MGLKTTHGAILPFCRAEVQREAYKANTKVFSGLCSFRRLQGKSVFLPFPVLRGPFFHLPSTSVQILLLLPQHLFSDANPFFSLKGPMWLHWAHLCNSGHYPHVKSLNLIHLQSPSCDIRQLSHRLLGLGWGHLLRAMLLSATQTHNGILLSNKESTHYWYGQQLGGILRTFCWVKEASL